MRVEGSRVESSTDDEGDRRANYARQGGENRSELIYSSGVKRVHVNTYLPPLYTSTPGVARDMSEQRHGWMGKQVVRGHKGEMRV